MTAVLALDVGTTKVRAVAFDERGEPVDGARWSAKHGAGDDPARLVEAAESALARVRPAAGEIDAVATSCFWHSLLALDARGRPLTPVLGWRGAQAADDADELARRLDTEAVHRRTGCVLHPSYWPAKLAWLRRTEPETFRRAARFVSFADYLYERLAGPASASVSMASGTGLFDHARAAWDGELLDAVAVEPERLPAIADDPVGDGVPWFPALGDGACSNAGVGCVTPERAALTIGTSAAYRSVRADAQATPRAPLFLYRVDAQRVVEGGAFSDGDNLLFWLKDLLGMEEYARIAAREPGGHGLTFLPLLGGERSPGWNPRATGAVAGLTFRTTKLELLQAALEGMAFRFAEVADRMPDVELVVATGGIMAADRTWLQLLADVLARSVTTTPVEESSARGAAVVALERLGAEPARPPARDVFEPRPERTAAYRAERERQRRLYEAVI